MAKIATAKTVEPVEPVAVKPVEPVATTSIQILSNGVSPGRTNGVRRFYRKHSLQVVSKDVAAALIAKGYAMEFDRRGDESGELEGE